MSPNAGEEGGALQGLSHASEYSSAHGAQINFGDLTLYLTYEYSTATFRNKSKLRNAGATDSWKIICDTFPLIVNIYRTESCLKKLVQ